MFSSSLNPSFPKFDLTGFGRPHMPHHDRERLIDTERKPAFSGEKPLKGDELTLGQLADDIEETYMSSLKGSDQLESGSRGTATDMSFQGIAMQSGRSAQIQIETQEGDIVTINFSQSESASRSAFNMSQDDSSINGYEESYSFSSDFTISIEGELNEDEQKSLKELMNKMHKVSDAFFNGNDKAAMKHAMKLGFDNQQIAGFSMDLNRQKSVQAVAAYQQTLTPEQAINTDLLTQASDFLDKVKTMLSDAQQSLQAMSKPQQTFNDLFTEIGLLLNNNTDEMEASEENQIFSGLVDNISQSIFAAEIQQKAA
ncbi:hypothetical protein GO003_023040 [Methylicorpusculum oleiharenae]|uniref:hypothetical protein n=1 Tax=Methylicorpusculum oleiharenae TaxID=1338687 RepID=UPI0013572A88|nr:hypothetical protein [Methylicorpusculum oleiharenae]MCD2453261.1 hypothetical protein [Methylicorpusculum oleiharenae]